MMILYLFESTHSVITAEKKCRKERIKCKIVPVPRSISSQCGMGIEIEPGKEEIVSMFLNESEICFKVYRNYHK